MGPFCTLDGLFWRNVNKAAEFQTLAKVSGLAEKSSHIQCHSLAQPRLKKKKKSYQYPAKSYLFIFGNSIVLYEHKSIQGEVCIPEMKMVVLLGVEKYLISLTIFSYFSF